MEAIMVKLIPALREGGARRLNGKETLPGPEKTIFPLGGRNRSQPTNGKKDHGSIGKAPWAEGRAKGSANDVTSDETSFQYHVNENVIHNEWRPPYWEGRG